MKIRAWILSLSFGLSSVVNGTYGFDVSTLSEEEKNKIYRKMGSRKRGWKRSDKISYAEDMIRGYYSNDSMSWKAFSYGAASSPAMEVSLAYWGAVGKGPQAPLDYSTEQYIWAVKYLETINHPIPQRSKKSYREEEPTHRNREDCQCVIL